MDAVGNSSAAGVAFDKLQASVVSIVSRQSVPKGDIDKEVGYQLQTDAASMPLEAEVELF